MLLEKFNKLYHQFTVGDLHFRVTDITTTTVTFIIKDNGYLEVGEFVVDYSDPNSLHYTDSENFPNTLERIRKTGDSDEVSRKVKFAVNSIIN